MGSLYLGRSGNSVPLSLTTPYKFIDVADINNDGLEDIVATDGDVIDVYQQNSPGRFSKTEHYDAVRNGWGGAKSLAVGDINGDGLPDIAFPFGGNKPNYFLATYLRNSNGSYNPVTTLPSYDCPDAIAIADVNGDGKKDVLALHGGWLALGVYLQTPYVKPHFTRNNKYYATQNLCLFAKW